MITNTQARVWLSPNSCFFANSPSMIIRNSIIIIVLFLLFGYDLSAQTTITGIVSDSVNFLVTNSKIENYLEHEQNITCEDQVFVHTDRNKYKPGDTIYFQSYVRNTFSGTFESSSYAMYALLFNDQHQLVDSSRFRITNATAPGWLAIPIDAKPGIYHLTAFTSLMQNSDPLDAFHLDLKVDAPLNQKMNIEVRLNKDNYHPGDTLEADLNITDAKGSPASQQYFKYSFIYKNYLIESDESKTTRQGYSFIRFIIPDSVHFISGMQISLYNNKKERFQVKNFSIPFSDEYLDLRFLPEGGNLIAGLEQVIGFNAVDRNGEPVEVEGLLKNSGGLVLDTVRSGPFGPGKFSCKAEKGMFLDLTSGPGKQKIWPLPVPDPSGVCLSITPVDRRSFSIEVQSDSYNNDTLIVSGTMNLKQIFERKIIMDRKQRLVIKTDDLPEGIVEVTLFNNDLKPVADRLVSVNVDEHLRYTIKTDKPDYSPGQEAEVTVNVSDADGNPANGIFSVSVVDSLSGYDPTLFTPGIIFALNYNPFFPSNLPSAVLEKGLENIPGDQLDLILMTYGWCRFNWNFDLTASNNKEQVNYDQLKIKLLYASGKHLVDRKLDLISLEGPNIMHLKTNNLGEIALPLASLPETTRSVTMMPDTKSSNRVIGVMLSIPYNEQYMKNKNMFLSQQTITSGISVETALMNKPALSEKTIELPEVSISATRKIEYINQYEEVYKYANVKSLPREKIAEFKTLEQAIRNIIVPYRMEPIDGLHPDGDVYLRPSHSFFGGNIKAIFVLDGMPLYNSGWRIVHDIPPDQISSISILDGTQGHTIYGEEASGGVIFINTNKSGLANIRTDWKTQDKSNNMLMPINLFRPNIEFYNPTRSEIESDPALKGRATVYWNPEVYFDGQYPVKIKYLNPLRDAKMRIVINGVSLNNQVGNQTDSYWVHEIK
jgi:alpha-2-macroglobulin-like protein